MTADDRLERLEAHLEKNLASFHRALRLIYKPTTGNEAMTTRADYPFTAWMLTPGFKPKEFVVSGPAVNGSYLRKDLGGAIHRGFAFDTRAECVADGFRRLDEAEARIEKQKASNAKRRATLEKAK